MPINSSVDTVNAAAAAIVTAESRVQPISSQKRRWGSFWSLYWCFGSLKTSKRISHAALVPEVDITEGTMPIPDNPNPSTSTVTPFIAPPSSPLPQSDPPTGTHTPVGILAFTPLSTNKFSSEEAHIFTIGPYAHEQQLVSPPVFSAFTTEPSTAAVTPPPESVLFTTPSSPEVPFAQLLTSSLNRARRNSGTHQKFALSCYEVHHLISPGSANSASGTSSPYLDKHSILEFRMVDASKFFDSKKIYTRKWDSTFGSGSVTPDGGLASHDGLSKENQSLPNLEAGSAIVETVIAQRLSFELRHDDHPKSHETRTEEMADKQQKVKDKLLREYEVMPIEVVVDCCKLCPEEVSVEHCRHKQSSSSLGSVKEFNFDSNHETPAISNPSSEWWAGETIVRDIEAEENWSFFPVRETNGS
ncbi:hypothetical protein vseg_001268 [Gypsophila vaccaria]